MELFLAAEVDRETWRDGARIAWRGWRCRGLGALAIEEDSG